MRVGILVCGLVVGSVVMLSVALAQPKPNPRPPAAPPAATLPPPAASRPAATQAARPGAIGPEEQALRQFIAAFDRAYNAGDARALAAMFTVDGEVIEQDGDTVHGRAAIEQMFVEEFQQHPKTKVEDRIESIRFLSPIAAVEEGVSTVTHEPGEPSESGHYSVLYVKQDGKWLIAADRDLQDVEATGRSELDQLGWLVGNWIDEGAEGLVKTHYEWDVNRRFLLGEFTLHIAGKPAMSGTQRIGWDPLAKKIRSWVFDSEGGFGESVWTRQENEWIVKLSGVSHDGQLSSSTHVYTRRGPDSFAFESHDRIHGNEVAADSRPLVVVREPPAAGK